MTGGDVVFLTVGLGWMCLTVVALEWWHRARTIWLSRLSARGLLAGTYTPAPENLLLGGWKWIIRQRVPVSDQLKLGRLEDEVDADRVTEVWRVRTTRRLRLFIGVGIGGLVVLGIALTVYEFLGWRGSFVLLALMLAVALVTGRSMFRRARAWGDGADLLM